VFTAEYKLRIVQEADEALASMELHHVDGSPEGEVKPMSRTDHRLGKLSERITPGYSMATKEIFSSGVRDAGDLAGVFEFDGETGYFYLYRVHVKDHRAILADAHITSHELDFDEHDVSVRWSDDQWKVGLFIRGVLWAAFDARDNRKYGRGYGAGRRPTVPREVAREFGCVS
jgi:hypothetical protein